MIVVLIIVFSVFIDTIAFGMDIKTKRINENSPVNSTVIQILPTNYNGIYDNIKIIGAGFNHYFELDKKLGYLRVIRELDLENPTLCNVNQYCCNVNKECKFGFLIRFIQKNFIPVITYKLMIIVDDVNDWSPKFRGDYYKLEINEGIRAVNTKKTLPFAEDKDFSAQNRQLLYYIKADFSYKEYFQLLHDSSQTSPSLLLRKSLDSETKLQYNITLVARDISGKEGSIRIIIDVIDINEFSPEFAKSTLSTVPIYESTNVNTVILQVNATDRDSYPNNQVHFYFDKSTPDVSLETFKINEITGEIRLITELNYERTKSYSIIILGVDSYQNPANQKSSTISIKVNVLDVNDYYPDIEFENSKNAFVKENQAIGALVTIVQTKDRDENNNGQVTCTLSKSETNFYLHRLDRQYYQIETNKVFNRELKSKYSLLVYCYDHGKPVLTSTATLLIRITDENDEPPQFVHSNHRFSIRENLPPKSFVLTKQNPNNVARLEVIDADESSNLTFFIDTKRHYRSQSAYGNISSLVSIDPVSGILHSETTLDHETLMHIKLRVCCNDTLHIACTEVVIDVEDDNDNNPYLDNDIYRLEIEENKIDYEKPLVIFQPHDLDSSNKGFNFNFDPATLDSTKRHFILRNNQLILKTPLDRENQTNHQFIVHITDNHPFTTIKLTAIAKVFVTVLDDNDNFPKFTFPVPANDSVNISCNEPVRYRITKLSATDLDYGENGTIVYELYKINPSYHKNLFFIDSQTGEIFINSPLISEKYCKTRFVLMISARDLGKRLNPGTRIYKHGLSKSYTRLKINLLDIPRSYTARITFMTPRLILTVILSCSTLFLICLLVAWALIICCYRHRNLLYQIKYGQSVPTDPHLTEDQIMDHNHHVLSGYLECNEQNMNDPKLNYYTMNLLSNNAASILGSSDQKVEHVLFVCFVIF